MDLKKAPLVWKIAFTAIIFLATIVFPITIIDVILRTGGDNVIGKIGGGIVMGIVGLSLFGTSIWAIWLAKPTDKQKTI